VSIEDVERAIARWEEAVLWISKGWDCIEEYANDLCARETIDEMIVLPNAEKLPSLLLSRIEKADQKFRDSTVESLLCVWHITPQFGVARDQVNLSFFTYNRERYWYYYRQNVSMKMRHFSQTFSVSLHHLPAMVY
jgi:hypothetical protein